MAGDWIKMRSDLFTHPKVVRISSALKADTLRTVGGLMSVWCLFDAHSVNGIMEGYSSETLDDHLRWGGFSGAMISVEWLVEDSGLLMLPRFDTHNGQSAKRRAQDADRKKVVRKTSASDADKMRTREEKRREEYKPPISPVLLRDFQAVRKAKKAGPITETVYNGIVREAEKALITAEQAIQICCERGWQGFKASWLKDQSFGKKERLNGGALPSGVVI
jgi:hypothetical protein